MSAKIISIALSSGLTLITSMAFASGTAVYPANPEKDYTAQTLPLPVVKSRAEVAAEAAAFARNPVTTDGWLYVGGERQWQMLQHRSDLIGGKLVHTDSFEHSAVKPTLTMSGEDKLGSRELYRNSF